MEEHVKADSERHAADNQYLSSKHPKTAKPPYYHQNTRTHQQEVGRFGHRILLRPIVWVIRFADAHNGLLTGVATAILAYLTYSLAHDSTEQARNTARQLEIMRLDERPWISIQGAPEPSAPLFLTGPNIDDSVALTSAYLTIKNVGKSPAREVNVFGSLVPEYIEVTTGLIAYQKVVCERAFADDSLPMTTERVQNTMFPGDEVKRLVDFSSTEKLQRSSAATAFVQAVFSVVGCIDYKFIGDSKHHRTGFIYNIVRNDRKSYNLLPGQQIAVESLVYARSLAGNGPAD